MTNLDKKDHLRKDNESEDHYFLRSLKSGKKVHLEFEEEEVAQVCNDNSFNDLKDYHKMKISIDQYHNQKFVNYDQLLRRVERSLL